MVAMAVWGKEALRAQRVELYTHLNSKEKGGYELREPTTPYSSDFDPKNATLSQENSYFWNESI